MKWTMPNAESRNQGSRRILGTTTKEGSAYFHLNLPAILFQEMR
jgi:hypothetical protein